MINYDYVERKVDEIRDSYNLGKISIKLYDFLEMLNIDAFKIEGLAYRGQEILGAIKSKDNKVAIIINSKTSVKM